MVEIIITSVYNLIMHINNLVRSEEAAHKGPLDLSRTIFVHLSSHYIYYRCFHTDTTVEV